jgi:hypothetical protein
MLLPHPRPLSLSEGEGWLAQRVGVREGLRATLDAARIAPSWTSLRDQAAISIGGNRDRLVPML